MKTTITAALVLLALVAGCGGDEQTDASGTAMDGPAAAAPPAITTDEHGQAKVTVTDEATADAQCEAMQDEWPSDVTGDVVYFVHEDGSTYISCGKG